MRRFETGLTSEVQASWNNAASLAAREKNSLSTRKSWGLYDQGLDEYEATFSGLGNRCIREYLEGRRIEGKRSIVFDIGSGGKVMRDLAQEQLITAGLSIGLTDPRTLELKLKDNQVDISVLEGDIQRRTTWKGIKIWLTQHDATTADLIISRSAGGFKDFPEPIKAVVLQRALGILSPQGKLLTDIPWNTPVEAASNWIKNNLISHPQLKTRYNHEGSFCGGVLEVQRSQ